MPIKNCKIAKNVEIHHKNLVNLYGCTIGEYTKIGPFVEIQSNVVIGKFNKISSHSFICSGVEIKNKCFIGHGVVFVNDKYPKSVDDNGDLIQFDNYNLEPTIIENNVSIGSGAIIMPGIIIGENSIIGSGSVVTKNVDKNTTVMGVPSRKIT